MKMKITIVLLILLTGFGGYGYYWYSGIIKTNEQAKEVLTENNQLKSQVETLENIRDLIITERNRCQKFITQEKGDFGDFEYCKGFLSWVKTQKIE